MGILLGGGSALRRPTAIALALAAAATLLSSASTAAPAAELQVTTTRSTFLPGDDELGAVTLIVARGTGMALTNTDIFAAHGLSSDESVGTSRLFESGVVGFRGTASVAGVPSLPPGTYGFHCPVHEDNMHGTLVVL